MNKKTYIKYHREVKDKEGKDLKVGDIVIYHDSYYNDVHRGIITHFTDRNVTRIEAASKERIYA